MTGGEMERAIEFLLDTQARTEARLSAGFEETNRQIAETSRQLAETDRRLAGTNQPLDSFAGTQAALKQVATETFAAQAQINAAQNRINASQSRISEDVSRGLAGLRRGWEDLQRAQEAAWVTINRLGDRQDRTEVSVERLAEVVRRHLER